MPYGQEMWIDDMINLWNTYQNPPWTADVMVMITSAAIQTIGRFDWEPYIPMMFTRILRSIDLPVSYKSLKSARNPTLCNANIAGKSLNSFYLLFFEKYIFIVSLDCLKVY